MQTRTPTRRPKDRRALIPLAVLPLVLISACGHTTGGTPAGRSPAPGKKQGTPSGTPQTGAGLLAALLTASDLPPGFAQDKKAAQGAPSLPANATCARLFSGLALHGELHATSEASVVFRARQGLVLVQERLLSFASKDNAALPVATLNQLPGKCPMVRVTDTQGVTSAYRVRGLRTPTVGDESSAAAVGITAPGFQGAADLVAGRLGTSVIIVSVSGHSADPSLLNAVAQAGAQKLGQTQRSH